MQEYYYYDNDIKIKFLVFETVSTGGKDGKLHKNAFVRLLLPRNNILADSCKENIVEKDPDVVKY